MGSSGSRIKFKPAYGAYPGGHPGGCPGGHPGGYPVGYPNHFNQGYGYHQGQNCNACSPPPQYHNSSNQCGAYDRFDGYYGDNDCCPCEQRPKRVLYHVHEHYHKEVPPQTVVIPRRIQEPRVQVSSLDYFDDLPESTYRRRKCCYYS
jgi:hypothetical protein